MTLDNHKIIHIFALLHFSVALGCRTAGIADDLLLTLLTMVLTVVICLNRQTTSQFMAICVIGVNVVGFALGWCTAGTFRLIFDSPLVIYPLSTLVSTEIIGWSLDALAKANRKRHPSHDEGGYTTTLRWLLVAFVVIIVVRLLIVIEQRGFEDIRSTILGIIVDYVFSCLALILVAESAIKAGEKAEAAKVEANLAQYRYLKLKQQVNPHFLFNSLNVLDCMIQEQSPEDASKYTHKLADIYRYMINNEERTLVPLRDEMEFVNQYVDLLEIRWPEGLEVKARISKEAMSRSVVPCSIQLLIENATKHNAVLPDDPLVIEIFTEDPTLPGDCASATSASPDLTAVTFVSVTNNKHPKMTSAGSTGLGLKYIRQQYEDQASKQVIVCDSKDSFTVKIPLL